MRLGIASILIGLVGAYGVRVAMEEEEVAPVAVRAEKFLVPLANQDLPVGRIVRKGDISLQEMTLEKMKRDGMPLELVMMSADQIIGRQLRKQLRLGEPFLTTAVYLVDAGPTYELKPGYRAIAVSVPVARGGYADANNVVDVYFTSTPRVADARTGQRAIPNKTIPVVNAVTVLKVTRPDATAASARFGQVPSFLLQVLPDQVAKFQALQGHGEFSFMIRPDEDVTLVGVGTKGMTLEDVLGIEDAPPPPPPQPVWDTVYYFRNNRSVKQFPIPQYAQPQQQLTQEQVAELQRLYNEQQAKNAATSTPDPRRAPLSPRRAPPMGDALPMDEMPTEVLPTDDDALPARAPRVPARRRPAPTLREPQLPAEAASRGFTPPSPYRPNELGSAPPVPRTTPLPRNLLSAAVNAADAVANPFGEDDAGELMP